MGSCERYTYTSNVARRRQAKTTNQTGTHVGQDVTVKVGHDHHAIRVRPRVLDNLAHINQRRLPPRDERAYLQACTIEKVLIVTNVRELLGYLTTSRQEHAIGHFPEHM